MRPKSNPLPLGICVYLTRKPSMGFEKPFAVAKALGKKQIPLKASMGFENSGNLLSQNCFKAQKQNSYMSEQLPLSEELCAFVGAIIGDGCIDGYLTKGGKSKHHVFITGDANFDRHYLSFYLSSIAKSVFDAKPHLYFRKKQRAMSLTFYDKNIFDCLTKRFGFVAGNKTFTVKIPEEILAAEEELAFATIRGIFDTDGCVFFDNRKIYRKTYGRIILKTVSTPLYEQLNEFLGKYFSLYSATKKWNGKRIYEITIYGNKQIEKWMRLIGFSNDRHLFKIRKLLEPQEGFEPSTPSLQNSCSSQAELLGH